jgi:hypothetical protein
MSGSFGKLLLSLAPHALVARFDSRLGRSQSVEGANKLEILLRVVAQRGFLSTLAADHDTKLVRAEVPHIVLGKGAVIRLALLGPEVPLAHRFALSWRAAKFVLTQIPMIRQTKRRVGRPKTTGPGTLIGIRLQDPDLNPVEAWSKHEGVTLQEAIRRLIRLGLAASRSGKKAP